MKNPVVDFNRSISSTLGLLFVMILGLGVAFFILRKASEIISTAPNMPALNAQKRSN